MFTIFLLDLFKFANTCNLVNKEILKLKKKKKTYMPKI